MNEKVIGVIPARYASTRLPGKPTVVIAGKPLIQWVWEAVKRCKTLTDVIIATDDQRILSLCESFGAKAVMTSPDCPSGSDRIAEAVKEIPCDIVANIQGDEPLIDPETIDDCVKALLDNPDACVSSAMAPFGEHEDYRHPHMVKVVTDSRSHAMYFSRAPIPDMSRLTLEETHLAPAPMKHVGLYVYRREALERYVQLPPSRYENIEKLEQLRLLEAGIRIVMITVPSGAIGVDTPEDVILVEKLLKSNQQS